MGRVAASGYAQVRSARSVRVSGVREALPPRLFVSPGRSGAAQRRGGRTSRGRSRRPAARVHPVALPSRVAAARFPPASAAVAPCSGGSGRVGRLSTGIARGATDSHTSRSVGLCGDYSGGPVARRSCSRRRASVHSHMRRRQPWRAGVVSPPGWSGSPASAWQAWRPRRAAGPPAHRQRISNRGPIRAPVSGRPTGSPSRSAPPSGLRRHRTGAPSQAARARFETSLKRGRDRERGEDGTLPKWPHHSDSSQPG